MSKVVGLHGEEIRPRGEPVADVVETAEKLLELARAGEIDGLTAVVHHADETVSAFRRGSFSFRVIGLLQTLIFDMCREQSEK